MKPKSIHNKKCTILKMVAAGLTALGLILLLTGPSFIEYLTSKMFEFEPNSAMFEAWRKTSTPLPFDVYFFNWTNPSDIYNHSIKPKFEEVGPYKFLQTIIKENITWNKNDTITYTQRRIYHVDEKSKTARNFSDTITTLNAVAVMSAYKARYWNYAIRKGLSLSLRSILSKVHVTKTASELLFEGYHDPLLSMANTFPFLSEPGAPTVEKFAWLRVKNNSDFTDGVLNMGTSGDNLGETESWNYKKHTSFYEGSCGNVEGSSGQFYKRPITKDSAKLFLPDLCTYVQLDFEKESYVQNVLGHKYVFGESAFDNGTKVKENSCYCTDGCIPSGMKNITNCRYGTPTFLSLPAFYKADLYYVNLVDGVEPKKELHDSYIVFEPKTGIPIEVNLALQINLILQPIESIALFEKVPKIFFPVMWFKQSATIPEEFMWKLNLFLKLPVIINIVASILILIGLILVVYYLYGFFADSVDEEKLHNRSDAVPLRSTK